MHPEDRDDVQGWLEPRPQAEALPRGKPQVTQGREATHCAACGTAGNLPRGPPGNPASGGWGQRCPGQRLSGGVSTKPPPGSPPTNELQRWEILAQNK